RARAEIAGTDRCARCAGYGNPLKGRGVEVLQRFAIVGEHSLSTDKVGALVRSGGTLRNSDAEACLRRQDSRELPVARDVTHQRAWPRECGHLVHPICAEIMRNIGCGGTAIRFEVEEVLVAAAVFAIVISTRIPAAVAERFRPRIVHVEAEVAGEA